MTCALVRKEACLEKGSVLRELGSQLWVLEKEIVVGITCSFGNDLLLASAEWAFYFYST